MRQSSGTGDLSGFSRKMSVDLVVSWLFVVIYAAIIFFFSSLPGRCVPQLFELSDKVYHFVEYFPFGVLSAKAFFVTFKRISLRPLLLFIFVIGLYALSDEIHQLFVVGRCFSYFDMLIDIIGAISGGFVYLWLK